ncbi:TetR family transcriptional regulator [Mycobacterium sp. E802]|uniref:TetR/AcrR family transcriptional regulator n=1 Tax=Mycobacterium sp. E802 TaxID=1834152 RepID=UPI0007FE1E1E|nr:TetR/AcrR family transcriptional regulator [Mycobacterium sp. E802]OBG88365.1 TetR family transcriptional regulator [Mycobacterium sp. E802]
MRSHGWSGHAPTSDDEAIERILDAADVIVEERGAAMKIADVARAVGVSRQTIYRYFPSSDALLVATAVRSADGFLDHLAAHVGTTSDPVTAVVDGVAFAIETLPDEPKIVTMLTNSKPGAGVASETSLAFSRAMLHRYHVDWEHEGFDEAALGELAELCLRILHSFLLEPGVPPRNGIELRDVLTRWIGPAVLYPHMARAMGAFSAMTKPRRRRARRTG